MGGYRLSVIGYRKNLFLLATCYLLLATLGGCASIAETTKSIAGVSTKSLEKARKNALTKTFNYDYFTCYTKALDTLRRIGAYIYAQNIKKHMIAMYVSEADTTPVGVFFKEIEAAKTQIEVSSPSTYAKELIAGTLFSSMDKPESLKEGGSDAVQ